MGLITAAFGASESFMCLISQPTCEKRNYSEGVEERAQTFKRDLAAQLPGSGLGWKSPGEKDVAPGSAKPWVSAVLSSNAHLDLGQGRAQ